MIRELQPGDDLLELLNASLRFDPLTPGLLEEKLESGPALVWDDGGLQGFCHGTPAGAIKLLAVRPSHRRRGIGSQLLGEVERRLSAPRYRVCESVPNYLVPGLDVRYTEALVFFERHGYAKFGECYNLRCELADRDFRREDPPGVTIRRARAQDPIMAFLQSHFPPWRPEVETMLRNDPISLHLAFQGEELIGFAGYDGNNLGTGWFGPMGTSPDHRNTGAGGVLLARCLEDFQRQGRTSCVIPWVGPWRFYARQCGAFIERVFWRYEKSTTTP